MDLNDIRTVMTVVAFLTFIGIIVWAYSSKRKHSFDEAARMALEDDEPIDQKGSSK
jgi:cytochrome c oxidase cbb3-type subunit 4